MPLYICNIYISHYEDKITEFAGPSAKSENAGPFIKNFMAKQQNIEPSTGPFPHRFRVGSGS
jgi:hypothetical protein